MAAKKTTSGPMSISSLMPPVGSLVVGGHARQSGDGAGDGARIERAQIVDPFADADGVDRQAELLGGGDQHPAARGAVQLGHDQTGHPGQIAENLDLRQPILPGGGVEHEQDVVRRFGVEAAEHAADLGKLFHQMGLVLEAAGGVDDQRVDPGRGGAA